MSLKPPQPGTPGFKEWLDLADAVDILGAGCAPGLTLDASETKFLAARLRQLFRHFGTPLPDGASDDSRLIGIAGAAIGGLLLRLETTEPVAWVNGDDLHSKANATIACGAERREGLSYDTPLYSALGVAPDAPQRDYCTDPDNCKRCAAPAWDQVNHHHAGIPIGTQKTPAGVKATDGK
jgi:hypothetical protein